MRGAQPVVERVTDGSRLSTLGETEAGKERNASVHSSMCCEFTHKTRSDCEHRVTSERKK